ncbi:grainyhead-like protein 2 homolog isoform X2 [Nematostella vectensis]|uniref:grainyhead-like protein 2 homolog isoform X2 n=1 Tax=Nematostella vectensis TaxID=45351 RepID=UPI00138FBEA3|nr:grainyhead-like protein 2 homolog isoform X2 [Nematostella vectensis]
MSTTELKKETVSEKMSAKVSEGTTVVMSSGSSTRPIGSVSNPGSSTPEREERAWKAYFAQATTDVPLTTQLLVNGEDSNMASTLGFLYDYYGVAEDSNQGPTSPGSSNQTSTTQGNESDSDTNNAESLSFLHSIQQIKEQGLAQKVGSSSGSTDISDNKTENSRDKSVQSFAIVQQIKSQPSAPQSCSRQAASSSRPLSFPSGSSTNKTNQQGQVSDVSSIALSQTPPEAYNFGPYSAALKATPTVFSAQDKYTFILEAPTSIVQRRGDDTLTYLNKGQFYAIDFEGNFDPPSTEEDIIRVKSVVHLVFRDEKDPRAELEHWNYWHSQQPNPQQRAFDIDRKSCQNIDENITDQAYNAAGFTWSPHLNAKIVIRINCLSTDFSPQKGVKGIPLHLQIDTYEDVDNPDAEPVHRAFCQIKVFRDKGAERKNKDESKSAERRMQKWMKQNPIGADPTMISPTNLFHPPSKYTQLLSTTPLGPKPVMFNPVMRSPSGSLLTSEDSTLQTSALMATIREREHKRTIQSALTMAKDELADLEVAPSRKVQRVHKTNRPAVTIYVKKEEEKVYNALMLDNLCIKELSNQIAIFWLTWTIA